MASTRTSQKKMNRAERQRWLKPVVRRVRVLRETERKEDRRSTEDKVGGLKIIHFGGLGEVGRNMSAIQYDNEIILIDAGVRFGDEKMPGIDFIIPNASYLDDKKDMVKAMFFTHGHMDHIGALPFVLDKIGDPDFYAAPLTKAILMKRMDEFKDRGPVNINLIQPGDEIKISNKLSVKVLRINHSIPDDLEIIVKTPIGNIVHTSDFKFDDTPVNDKPADVEEMERMSREEGVLLLMSDSTGAENEGHSLSEQDITENLDKIFRESTGMLVLGTFASLINRVQQIITIAEKYGRKVVFDGYSMKTNVEICKKLGYLKMAKGTQIMMDEIDNYPRNKVVAVVTGAQGEGNAVLMRIANGEHKYVRILKHDTIVFSSSVIPGNEKDVQFLKDQLYRNGAKVLNYKMLDVHAGGHGNKEDLRRMLQLMKPKLFMPIHGQYSMMINHGLMAQEEGVEEKNIIIGDNGTVVHIEKDGWFFDRNKAPSDYVFVDGLGVGDIGNVVLRDRQVLAEDGFIVIVVLVDSSTHKVKTSPDIISRGFVYLKEHKDLLMQIRKKIRHIVEVQQMREPNAAYLKDQIRNQIGLFLFQKTERRPMVLPVLIEV
ncbi:MAG: RNA-metabolising metallo-beta-lactamase [Candidatus Yanofskybacteria bacterium GW2011_GWA2_44_9]|uniref:Ribonuclease J n=1 Tax=Candidatus Yanofskybacteria bacterium GW2011_GWA2_44_9 TaxID=1619025 RepID=A0A0G1KE46_9BACT|nr:MAG: RNA-metabolising metallo-beta-lactamase [Candidatus Yanofskybacteria bacterium GW2011_GWA2_44_9]